MISAATAPLYLEQKISAKLGLSRDAFRHVRREVLTKGRDWSEIERHTVLTAAAVQRVLEYMQKGSHAAQAPLDFSDCLYSAAPAKNGAPASAEPGEEQQLAPEAPPLVELTVFRIYPNRGRLIATDPEGARVDVRVLNNRNFRPRMTLRGRIEKPGVYVMEGRCPRYPGRY